MGTESFVYVTYIRTTQEKLWDALVKPEFNREFWFGCWQETTWTPGAPWKLILSDGRVGDIGEVIENEKPRRLVLKWRNEFRPGLREEGYSRCTIELEPIENAVKLTVVHEIDWPRSKFIEAVSGGWPKVLSSLKSFLETGHSLGPVAPYGPSPGVKAEANVAQA